MGLAGRRNRSIAAELTLHGWRRGVVVSGVRQGPVTTGMGDRLRAGIPSRAVTS